MTRFTHRSIFNGDQWITGRWETDIKTPWVEPLDAIARAHFVPQPVDKVSADVIRIDVGVARLVGFNGASEKREVFENVSEGRDEVGNGLLNRMIAEEALSELPSSVANSLARRTAASSSPSPS